MTQKKMHKIGVYPCIELKKIIEADAEKEGRSVSNYIVNILTNYINQKKKNEKKKKPN